MKERALVLLSGGQDSTTALFWAKREYTELHALTFNYGQRHATEIAAAQTIANMAGCVSWQLEAVPFRELGAKSAILDHRAELTEAGGLADDHAPGGLPSSFLPGRNLVFFAMAAVKAAALRCHAIVTGVSQTDYSGYPDCREEFVDVMSAATNLAMPDEIQPITIVAPLVRRSKAATVLMARDLGAVAWSALGHSVTCYRGQRPGCGTCPACVLRDRGFRAAGLEDPAVTLHGPPDERTPVPKAPVIP